MPYFSTREVTSTKVSLTKPDIVTQVLCVDDLTKGKLGWVGTYKSATQQVPNSNTKAGNKIY